MNLISIYHDIYKFTNTWLVVRGGQSQTTITYLKVMATFAIFKY